MLERPVASFRDSAAALPPLQQHRSNKLLHEVVSRRALHACMQPIIDFKTREIIGYEGLIRGPADSPFHSPQDLFAAAAQMGLRPELELLSQQVVLETFVRLGLPGKLFLNVSPNAFVQPNGHGEPLLVHLRRLGMRPDRVIIELTENEPTGDFSVMRLVIGHYRSLGFEIAIDDLGEGFASLRLWSELHPEFVKLDMHFTQGVSQDPLKFQFVRAIHQIAESCGTRVIAEGIETLADLRVIRDIGIVYGQGYFIARPSASPALELPQTVRQALSARGISVYPELGRYPERQAKARRLALEIEPISPETDNNAVYARFDANPDLLAIPVVRDGTPIGLIQRHSVVDRFARPYRRELYGRRPCITTMDPDPLVVDSEIGLQELSMQIVASDRRHLADGFILTKAGRYLGLATGHDLMREMTQLQINAARYANPLTLLPGNVPISEHVGRLIESGAPFCACYCDLDNFKPYNDVFGYQKGDEIIVLAGRALTQVCDPDRDFVGHIGGDDFMVLFQSSDWEARCQSALDLFGQAVWGLFTDQGRARGGFVSEDRGGREVFYPFPTLSIGAVPVEGATCASHLEVSAAAAEAKKLAKRVTGNSLFIERRRLFS